MSDSVRWYIFTKKHHPRFQEVATFGAGRQPGTCTLSDPTIVLLCTATFAEQTGGSCTVLLRSASPCRHLGAPPCPVHAFVPPQQPRPWPRQQLHPSADSSWTVATAKRVFSPEKNTTNNQKQFSTCISSRSVECPHPGQSTRKTEPCSSTTSVLPAAECSRSTFCVTSRSTRP
eukprot:SAG31_NODE_5_length_43735_cov_42.922266_23_plen_174_part_00